MTETWVVWDRHKQAQIKVRTRVTLTDLHKIFFVGFIHTLGYFLEMPPNVKYVHTFLCSYNLYFVPTQYFKLYFVTSLVCINVQYIQIVSSFYIYLFFLTVGLMNIS